jgi:2-keto-3-deoxy-L-fuconate dehydrogenase
MERSLHGKTCLVTGGASGIGRETSLLFAREGARVVVVDIDGDAAEQTAAAIRDIGGECSPFQADVADADDADRVIRSVSDVVDVLMACAAVSVGGTVITTTSMQWETVLRTNVLGVVNWVRAVLPGMSAKGRGSIVTVASQLAYLGARNSASYAASKGAVISLTKAIAVDHAAQGIRANAIVPGAIETPFLDRAMQRSGTPAAASAALVARYPMGRFGRASEVAEAALFLASDASSFVTGVALPVDGGRMVD